MPLLARRNEYDEDDNGKDDKEAEERLQEGEEEEGEITWKINYRWRRNIVLQIHYHQWGMKPSVSLTKRGPKKP